MNVHAPRLLLCLVLLAWRCESVSARPGELVPVDGPPLVAELIGSDEAWNLQFEADGEPRELELSAGEVVRWGKPAEPGDGGYLLLADGGLLVAEVIRADAERITVHSFLLGELTIPLDRVAAVVFQPPAGMANRDRFDLALIEGATDTDRVILDNDDRVDGTLEQLNGEAVTVDGNLGRVRVELERVVAIVFNATVLDRTRPQGLCAWVGLGDGTRLIAGSLAIADSMARISIGNENPWEAARESLVWLQPLTGRVVYLSHLEPQSYRHIPFLTLSWDYRVGRNVDGARLRAGGDLYVEGIGMHSAARLTYDLDEPYRRFEARVAIDEQVAPRGSVVFRVYADGQQRFASPIVRGGDDPLDVSVDLGGARRVSLIVDFADRGDELDHAQWLDARLVR